VYQVYQVVSRASLAIPQGTAKACPKNHFLPAHHRRQATVVFLLACLYPALPRRAHTLPRRRASTKHTHTADVRHRTRLSQAKATPKAITRLNRAPILYTLHRRLKITASAHHPSSAIGLRPLRALPNHPFHPSQRPAMIRNNCFPCSAPRTPPTPAPSRRWSSDPPL
jgi:hypothetical protein